MRPQIKAIATDLRDSTNRAVNRFLDSSSTAPPPYRSPVQGAGRRFIGSPFSDLPTISEDGDDFKLPRSNSNMSATSSDGESESDMTVVTRSNSQNPFPNGGERSGGPGLGSSTATLAGLARIAEKVGEMERLMRTSREKYRKDRARVQELEKENRRLRREAEQLDELRKRGQKLVEEIRIANESLQTESAKAVDVEESLQREREAHKAAQTYASELEKQLQESRAAVTRERNGRRDAQRRLGRLEAESRENRRLLGEVDEFSETVCHNLEAIGQKLEDSGNTDGGAPTDADGPSFMGSIGKSILEEKHILEALRRRIKGAEKETFHDSAVYSSGH